MEGSLVVLVGLELFLLLLDLLLVYLVILDLIILLLHKKTVLFVLLVTTLELLDLFNALFVLSVLTQMELVNLDVMNAFLELIILMDLCVINVLKELSLLLRVLLNVIIVQLDIMRSIEHNVCLVLLELTQLKGKLRVYPALLELTHKHLALRNVLNVLLELTTQIIECLVAIDVLKVHSTNYRVVIFANPAKQEPFPTLLLVL